MFRSEYKANDFGSDIQKLRLALDHYLINLPITLLLGKQPHFETSTSPDSIGVSKVSADANVFSIFYGKKDTDEAGASTTNIAVKDCLSTAYSVHSDEPSHLFLSDHPNGKGHMHFTRDDHKLVTPNQFECWLKQVDHHQKSQNHCLDGKTNCFLTTSDSKKMLDSYKKYYPQEKAYLAIYNNAADLQRTFVHAFLTTFLHKYIKPGLISKGYNPSKTAFYVGVLTMGLGNILNKSLWNFGASMILSHVVAALLARLKVSNDVIHKVTNHVRTVSAIIKNPLSLVDLGITNSGAGLGEAAAYALIRRMPKLKLEPEVTTKPEPKNPVVVDQPGLQHRP